MARYIIVHTHLVSSYIHAMNKIERATKGNPTGTALGIPCDAHKPRLLMVYRKTIRTHSCGSFI
jgi:hypothetical protein